MKNTMTYKRYDGTVELNEKEGIFFGRVLGIQDKIAYEAYDAKTLVENFHGAVDEYLQRCEEEQRPPEPAFRGSFNIRISSKLHRALAIHAIKNGMNLNQLVNYILEEYMSTHDQECE